MTPIGTTCVCTAWLVSLFTSWTTYIYIARLGSLRTPGTTHVCTLGCQANFRGDHSLAACKAAVTLRLYLTATIADTVKDSGYFLLLRCLGSLLLRHLNLLLRCLNPLLLGYLGSLLLRYPRLLLMCLHSLLLRHLTCGSIYISLCRWSVSS